MSDSMVTIRLDMVPDRRLAPNASGTKTGWTKGPWIAAQREMAKYFAGPVASECRGTDGPVAVEVVIYWGKSLKMGTKRARIEQDRRLDWDSCTAICKPMIDGALVDSGILEDDRQIQYGAVKQEIDPEGRGYTILNVWEVSE